MEEGVFETGRGLNLSIEAFTALCAPAVKKAP